jgi:hypothetical protein
VDANGEPRIAYHGTPHAFDAFDADEAERRSRTPAKGCGFFFADDPAVARSYGPRVVAAFLNVRSPYVNEESNTWKQMTLSNGRALTGAPPAAQRGYRIVPADAVPPDATVEQSVGDGAHVSVSVPYPTLASINQVVRWADASGFDGIVAHDVFGLGPENTGMEQTASTTFVVLDARQIWIAGAAHRWDASERPAPCCRDKPLTNRDAARSAEC